MFHESPSIRLYSHRALVVIVITAVLIGSLAAGRPGRTKQPGRAQCTNNLKQLGLALHNYHDVNGTLPMDRYNGSFNGVYAYGLDCYSVHVRMLPYMEQTPLFNTFNFGIDCAATPPTRPASAPPYRALSVRPMRKATPRPAGARAITPTRGHSLLALGPELISTRTRPCPSRTVRSSPTSHTAWPHSPTVSATPP